MPTLNENIVRTIIANEGVYPGDRIRAVKAVRYQNNWGTSSYAVVYEGQNPMRYEESPDCREVEVLWTYEKGLLMAF